MKGPEWHQGRDDAMWDWDFLLGFLPCSGINVNVAGCEETY